MNLPTELIQEHNLFTGLDALSIDVANHYGLDKETWIDRMLWTEIHRDELDTMVDKADSPMQYRKSVRALELSDKGFSIGHNMFLDAAQSGLQIYACLTGCKTTAANCGLIDTDVRKDAYTSVTGTMNTILGTDIKIPRKDAKDATMKAIYNSKAEPIRIFGEDTPELFAFYEAMHKEVPGAMVGLDAINGMWNSSAFSHTWRLPDNWQDSPLKPCYNTHVHKLKGELECLKKLAKKGIEEV